MKKYKLKKEIMSDSVCGMGLASTWRVGLTSQLLMLTVKLFVCVWCMEMNGGRNTDMTR